MLFGCEPETEPRYARAKVLLPLAVRMKRFKSSYRFNMI